MPLKEKIIIESLKLFSLKGFLGTTIDDILKAAKSSKGGFYNHFKSKEDLFYYVLIEARKIWRERNLSNQSHNPEPIADIRRFLTNFRDDYLKDSDSFPGGCIFIKLLVELKDQHPHLAREINKGFQGMKGMIHKGLLSAQELGELKETADPEAMTEMIFNGILGATISYNADRSEKNLDKAFEYIIGFLDSFTV